MQFPTPPHWIPTKIVHFNHKLNHKSNIHLSKIQVYQDPLSFIQECQNIIRLC